MRKKDSYKGAFQISLLHPLEIDDALVKSNPSKVPRNLFLSMFCIGLLENITDSQSTFFKSLFEGHRPQSFKKGVSKVVQVALIDLNKHFPVTLPEIFQLYIYRCI